MPKTNFKIFPKNTPSLFPIFEGTEEESYNWLNNKSDGIAGLHVYDVVGDSYQDAHVFMDEYEALMFVPKFYKMDPKTDDVLFNGTHLANGMRVLIEDSKKRMDMDDELSEWEKDRALENNRWCTVGALEVNNVTTRFIGVYDDGSKRMRVFDTAHAWLVKIDSVRQVSVIETKRYQDVYSALKVAFARNEELVKQHDYPADAVHRHVEYSVKQILDLLG